MELVPDVGLFLWTISGFVFALLLVYVFVKLKINKRLK